RYFPEPDLPPLVLTADWIERIRNDLPELPAARAARFGEDYQLKEYDRDVLTANPHIADYYESVARAHGDFKSAANWVMGEVLAHLKTSRESIRTLRLRPADLAQLLDLVRDGIISHTAAKQIFTRTAEQGGSPAQIAQEEGLLQ